jgi:hypothetical protein
VDKNITPATIRLNKSEALSGIEKLHRSVHDDPSQIESAKLASSKTSAQVVEFDFEGKDRQALATLNRLNYKVDRLSVWRLAL